MSLILPLIPLVMIYYIVGYLSSGLFRLVYTEDRPTRREKDLFKVLGAIWPVTLTSLFLFIALYVIPASFLKSTKRLIKGDY
ncbi:hypothetical protein SL4_44 [Pseudomonas phage SL4]|nr:hypothetical protein SL4_44 [Pseudomonas phage SL4]